MNSIPTNISTYQHGAEEPKLAPNAPSAQIPTGGPNHPMEQSLLEKIQSMASISELLRLVGAAAILASLTMFLFQGWSDGNDISRYLKLFGQTGLLAICGLLLSTITKDQKGARLFFGLSLVSVTANFTILGALIYSSIQLDGVVGTTYPSIALWEVAQSQWFWPICFGACAALTAMSRFSYRIFSRHQSSQLTWYFIAMNAAILLPVRGSIAISIVLLALAFATAKVVRDIMGQESYLGTLEQRFVVATLFLPIVIIAARFVCIYAVDDFMFFTLSALGYGVMRQLTNKWQNSSLVSGLLPFLLFVCGICFNGQLIELVDNHVTDTLLMAIGSIGLMALTFDQIKVHHSISAKTWIHNTSALLITAANLLCLLWSDGAAIASVVFINGILLATFNHFAKTTNTQVATIASITMMIAASIGLGSFLLSMVELGNWVAMSAVGVSIIILASVYERFGHKLLLTKGTTDIKSHELSE